MFPDIAGKGVFIWNPRNIFGGDPVKIADELERSKTTHVCVKICDGVMNFAGGKRDPMDAILEIRKRGIRVGGWGYTYIKYDPRKEAQVAVDAINHYKPEYYLIDAEADAKNQYNKAVVYANEFARLLPAFPRGMCSFWYPPYHPEFPWKPLRTICHFDAPQVYWRGYNPVGKLAMSKKAYSNLTPKLPYLLAGGDLYLEHGIKPTPAQVVMFMEACRDDPEIRGVLMWAMDQNETTPELWETYVKFEWDTEKALLKNGMAKFLESTKSHLNENIDRYLAEYQEHKSAGTLPSLTDRDREDAAIVAGMRKILT